MIAILTVFRCSSGESKFAVILYNLNIVASNQFNLIACFNEMIFVAHNCAAIAASRYTPAHITQGSVEIACCNKVIFYIVYRFND